MYHPQGWISIDVRQSGAVAAQDPESEKITINLGYVDLGRIDLLVQEGFFSNRTDFIRTAIRNQLRSQSECEARISPSAEPTAIRRQPKPKVATKKRAVTSAQVAQITLTRPPR
jgi:Arc/MetJ-type ribon-helix-helix transcriptional regulator